MAEPYRSYPRDGSNLRDAYRNQKKVAATSRYITNSVCQTEDSSSTVRTKTIWHTTKMDTRIINAATTPKRRERP